MRGGGGELEPPELGGVAVVNREERSGPHGELQTAPDGGLFT